MAKKIISLSFQDAIPKNFKIVEKYNLGLPPFSEKPKSNSIYPQESKFNLPGINNPIPCKINFTNLSEKIQNKGLFFEGKLNANNTNSYFHWFCFEPQNIKIDLDLAPELNEFARAQNKKIPRGICTTGEFIKINQQMKQMCGYNFLEALVFGKNEADLIKEAKKDKNIILVSDFSNFPYNKGFFLIKNGEMLDNGLVKIKPGKSWFLVKHKNSNNLKPQILTLKDNKAIEENIENIDFTFTINPIIVNGKILTDITDVIPGTNETVIHNWRGGNAHIIKESIAQINRQFMEMVDNSQYKVDPELKDILHGNNSLLVANNINAEKLNNWYAWNNGTFPYQPGIKDNLQPGQYYFDQKNETFYTNLERANYGHTIFAITEKGKFIIFKLFNKEEKNNGLLIERLGSALAGISQAILNNNGDSDYIVFAGVGANGGDVRTFLGMGEQPGFKNIPEDNQGVKLQEKLSARSTKPLYLKVLAERF